MCVHALHTVHAVPDLRVAGGRLGDDQNVHWIFRAWVFQHLRAVDLIFNYHH